MCQSYEKIIDMGMPAAAIAGDFINYCNIRSFEFTNFVCTTTVTDNIDKIICLYKEN